MLSLPPTNHFTHGGFHSMTESQGRLQRSVAACSAQKPSGSASARA